MANKTKLEEFKSLGPGRRKAKTPSELDLGTGKASSKRTQKPELNLGTGKASSKRTGPAELNLGSGKASSKRSKPKTKVQPPKLRPKNLKKKEKNSDNKKPKVVTEKMLADSPFTSLRDYLNNRDGKKRSDGKKVKLKSGKTKTTVAVDSEKFKPKNPRGPKVRVRQGTPDQKRGTKVQKASEKKLNFLDKIIKGTKDNFKGDRKKKTGRFSGSDKKRYNQVE